MDPWIHGSAAGAAARAAAGAAAGAAASAATVCTYYVIIGGRVAPCLCVHDKVHTAAAPAAAPAAALAEAAAADPWIHGSISFIMHHIFLYHLILFRRWGTPPRGRMAIGLAKRALVWQRGVRQTTVSEKRECFFMIFGRTKLRIGVSGAKFDAEVDFDVHVTPAP